MLLVFTGFNLIDIAGAETTKIPAEVQKYVLALQEVQKRPDKQPIEPIYTLGIVAADKLVEVLESLSLADFNLVRDQMKGFKMNRIEVVYVSTDTIFFKNLALQKGQKVDIAFFDLFHYTKPHGWPVYIERLTDYGGCTKYGSGLLVDFYGKWQKFQDSFPSAYSARVGEVLNDIKGELTLGTNACGSVADIVRELQLFIKTYPDNELSKELNRRIKEIEMNKSK